MKIGYLFILLVILASSQSIGTEPPSIEELRKWLGQTIDSGMYPRDFEGLVATSSLIVKGKFGRFMGQEKFFGYGETRESFAESRNIPVEEVGDYGLPRIKYEIIISEKLYGDIDDDKVLFGTFGNDPSDRTFTNPSVDRLFFLIMTEDLETYTVLGSAFILNDDNGVYGYDYIENSINDLEVRAYEFSPTMEVGKLDQIVRDEIARQGKL